MPTKEILTLQVGHYANFVGSHWWNVQESSFCYDERRIPYLEINHNVLFREGQNPRREVTFTPRLIAIDLKGSLKTLKQEGVLYELQESKQPESLWRESVDVYKTEPPRKNEFLEDLEKEDALYYRNSSTLAKQLDEDKDVCQVDSGMQVSGGKSSPEPAEKTYNLDDCVEVWSDFLKTHLHPRSVALINDFFHDDELEPFDIYGCGIQAYKNEKNRDSVEERLRFFTEECDYLQGFNLLIDGYDGFAGISNGILQFLEDEYYRKPRVCFPLYQPIYRQIRQAQIHTEEVHRLFSTLLCFDSLANYSSIFCPISTSTELRSTSDNLVPFDLLTYNPSLPYHTSSILAAALDTITLPTRLKNNPTYLSEISQNLGGLGRKMMILGFSFPFPMQDSETLATTLDHYNDVSLLHSLTPHCRTFGLDPAFQMAVLRGISKQNIYHSHGSAHNQLLPTELFARHLQRHSPRSLNAVAVINEPLKVACPFPNIFAAYVGTSGLVTQLERKPWQHVKTVPCAASLVNSANATDLLRMLLREASRTNFSKYHRCLEMGIEGDDVLEMLQSLSALRDNYLENMDEDDDDDDL